MDFFEEPDYVSYANPDGHVSISLTKYGIDDMMEFEESTSVPSTSYNLLSSFHQRQCDSFSTGKHLSARKRI